ncbi:cold-shock protein [Paenibacillus sp. OVF10]|nr:cold-shock protein [Paenibacillus sp. OVF10]
MEVPDKRKPREESRTSGQTSYGKGNGQYTRSSGSGARSEGRDVAQRRAISHSDRRDFEVHNERDEDRLGERRGSGEIRNHKAFSTTGISPTAASSSSSKSHTSGSGNAARTETVAVWKCSSSTCKAWLRQKPAVPSKATKKASSGPPACPLCSGSMEAGTRQVPVTGRFGK